MTHPKEREEERGLAYLGSDEVPTTDCQRNLKGSSPKSKVFEALPYWQQTEFGMGWLKGGFDPFHRPLLGFWDWLASFFSIESEKRKTPIGNIPFLLYYFFGVISSEPKPMGQLLQYPLVF